MKTVRNREVSVPRGSTVHPFGDEHQNLAIGKHLRDVYNQSDKNLRDHFAMHPEEVP